jgi:ubiquinone/menaquinone biosynthesis C-methylase UbiE
LDVGCGSGAAVRNAATVSARSVGVDLSPGMIARARELSAGLDGAEFVEADSEALPFGNGEFSAILCTTSFHHYPNPVAAMGEMARVLAFDGRLVIGDGCTDNRFAWLVNLILRTFQRSHVSFYSSEHMERFIRCAGLSLDQTQRLWEGGYMICSAYKEEPS